MTKGNSVKGYAIAVNLRKRKTLLVEGKSDRRLVKRLAAGADSLSNNDFVLDTAEIISSKDPSLSGDIGNKSKVLAAQSNLSKNKKFAALVDREWEGLWDKKANSWLPYTEADQQERLYKTAGHSIENYGFSPVVFHKKIIDRCYETVSKNDADEAIKSFFYCLKMAVAVSQKAMQSNTITKMSGILRPENFLWNSSGDVRVVESKRMRDEFSSRGIGDVEAYISDINSIYEEVPLAKIEDLGMYPHGHLGEEVIFGAISARLSDFGVSKNDISILFTESIENREVYLKEYIEGLDDMPEPFGRILNFLKGND